MEYVAVFSDGSRASTLAHHGIKNQKWGIRRFQNEDGTLTPAGIERYRKMRKPSFETHYNPATVGAGVAAGFKTGGPLGGVVGGLAATAATGATYALAKRRYDKYEKAYNKTVDGALKDLNGKAKTLSEVEDRLSEVCYSGKNFGKLNEIATFLEKDKSNSVTSGHAEELVAQLAYRFNEQFDHDHILDQKMSDHIIDYESGLISKKELDKAYQKELFDYSAWMVENVGKDELMKVAKSFYKNHDMDEDGPDNEPSEDLKSYLKRYRESNEPSWVEKASSDKKNWRQVNDAKGEREFEYIGPDSGRYQKGSSTNGKSPNVNELKKLASEIHYYEKNSADDEAYARYRKTLPLGEKLYQDRMRRSNKRDDRRMARKMKSGILSMKNSGHTIAEIADSLNMSESEVEYYLYGM